MDKTIETKSSKQCFFLSDVSFLWRAQVNRQHFHVDVVVIAFAEYTAGGGKEPSRKQELGKLLVSRVADPTCRMFLPSNWNRFMRKRTWFTRP